MSHAVFVATLITAFVFLIRPIESARHNILFVVVDDLPVHIAPYLDPNHALNKAHVNFTPTLSKLASESVMFHRAYVQNAACNPSRASMLTSRTPIELQLFTKFQPSKMKNFPLSLPEILKRTHHVIGVGKVFHHQWPEQFNKFGATGTGDTVCGDKTNECILQETKLVDSAVTSKALNLIRSAPSNKPWAAFVGFHRPHWKYSTSQKAFDELKSADPIIQEQTASAAAEGSLEMPNERNMVPQFSIASTRQRGPQVQISKAVKMRKWVFASTQWMDTCLGRLLDGLASSKLLDKTIVVFTGDNGVMLFDRSQNGKSVLFSAAKHVPLFIRHPDYPVSFNKTTSVSVDLMDLYPTLLEMESIPIPQSLSGSSVFPIIKLLGNQQYQNQGNQLYSASTKYASVTIETRCTFANPSVLTKIGAQVRYSGDWRACHQVKKITYNRAEMFGLSIQTRDWNYIEWRAAQWDPGNQRVPRWDTSGLWARELYSFAGDDGLTRMNNVEFEATNLAPCTTSCYPRGTNFPRATRDPNNNDEEEGGYRLADDEADLDFYPPDLDEVDPKYRGIVQRLSLVLRSIVRDKKPICNGHGSANPRTGLCDECLPGWRGTKCEIPIYEEFSTDVFTMPPTPEPTQMPTTAPTKSPTLRPTKTPTRPTKAPTRFPTKRRRKKSG